MKILFGASLFTILISVPLATPAFAAYPAVPLVSTQTSTNQILAKTTEIRVNSNLDSVQTVEVKINGVTVKAEVIAGGKILVGALIGPKDKVEVTIQTNTGVKSDVQVAVVKKPVSLANVNFAVNSSALTKESRALLNRVAKIIIAKGYTIASSIGHTDPDGSSNLNQALSIARSNTVVKYLKSRGVGANVSGGGGGSKKPIASNDTQEGKALNRRVEIRVSW
jgi:outer membrane protein OmpA-like peptidoglycan-associated protein